VVWANDNQTLFYVTKDKLDRPHKVRSPANVLQGSGVQALLPLSTRQD